MLVLPSLIVVPPTVTANSVATSEVEPPLVQHRLVHADIVAKRGLGRCILTADIIITRLPELSSEGKNASFVVHLEDQAGTAGVAIRD